MRIHDDMSEKYENFKIIAQDQKEKIENQAVEKTKLQRNLMPMMAEIERLYKTEGFQPDPKIFKVFETLQGIRYR